MSLDCKKNKTMSKIGKIVLPVLTVCWMMVIFWFSAAPAPESSEMSYTVGIQIGKIAVADFDAWTTEKQNAFAEKIEYPIRKMAHATEYAVFAMLLCGAWFDDHRKRKLSVFFAWGTATVYAMTDEFHQLFVPGRSGQIKDVLLDSCGAAVGVLLLMLVAMLLRVIRKSMAHRNEKRRIMRRYNENNK